MSQHRVSPTLPRRDSALDGLRGLAIVLVVLSHGWTVYPFDDIAKIAPFDALLLAGNVAVTLFLVISGYLVTRSMLMARDAHGASGPWRTFLRRFLRISASVAVLLLAVGVMSETDTTDTAPRDATQKSILHVATYTWNWFVRAHALEARGDLGPLWYLSVEMQFYVVLALVVALWGARRRELGLALLILLPLVTWWRWHNYDAEGWYSSLLRTSTRIDGLLWGALVALLVPYLQATTKLLPRLRRRAAALLGASSLVIVGIVMSSSRFDIGDYMKLQGLIMAMAVALFVAANHFVEPTTLIVRALSWGPLRVLGSVSLTIYVWHSPLLWAVARHTTDWSNVTRTMVALALLVLVTVVTHRLIDRPVQRWTSHIGRQAPREEGAHVVKHPSSTTNPN
ncbi:acyltransferase family protein [Knoellia sp. CPCC 206453]|uniref:acyltransferase family protein n=1 Tax=Knoellia pratensis TaxID=3404796 RepID=UPI00361CDFF0